MVFKTKCDIFSGTIFGICILLFIVNSLYIIQFCSQVTRYQSLIDAYDEIRSQEARFKADCKRELQKMDEELSRLHDEVRSGHVTFD